MVIALKFVAMGNSLDVGHHRKLQATSECAESSKRSDQNSGAVTQEKLGAVTAEKPGVASSASLEEYQLSKALDKVPGLFELSSYVFANGNLLGGPYFDFKDWDDFIHRKGPFKEVRTSGFVLAYTSVRPPRK